MADEGALPGSRFCCAAREPKSAQSDKRLRRRPSRSVGRSAGQKSRLRARTATTIARINIPSRHAKPLREPAGADERLVETMRPRDFYRRRGRRERDGELNAAENVARRVKILIFHQSRRISRRCLRIFGRKSVHLCVKHFPFRSTWLGSARLANSGPLNSSSSAAAAPEGSQSGRRAERSDSMRRFGLSSGRAAPRQRRSPTTTKRPLSGDDRLRRPAGSARRGAGHTRAGLLPGPAICLIGVAGGARPRCVHSAGKPARGWKNQF